MELKQEAYTVVEVAVKLTEGFKENFDEAISNQLEEVGEAGCENTEKIDQVNTFQSTDKTADWYVNFIGPSHDFEEIQNAVVSFMEEFKENLASDEFEDDWIEALSTPSIPQVETFHVITTRPYLY